METRPEIKILSVTVILDENDLANLDAIDSDENAWHWVQSFRSRIRHDAGGDGDG